MRLDKGRQPWPGTSTHHGLEPMGFVQLGEKEISPVPVVPDGPSKGCSHGQQHCDGDADTESYLGAAWRREEREGLRVHRRHTRA